MISMIILGILLFIRISPPTFFIDLGLKSQIQCVNYTHSPSKYQDILWAVLCGFDRLTISTEDVFKKTQLIHLLVVSGSHLLLGDMILAFLKVPFFFRWIALLFFTFASGLNPPCLRSLISLSLSHFIQKRKIYIPHDFISLVAGLFTLVLFPNWWTSRSLILSWMASLGLNLRFLFKNEKDKNSLFLISLSIYLMMIPPL
ncbi:MAG TPA: ComEC/Rec2 family competence protein, partial [Pseudobdellovibrionaceae bacterium]|nr:ComEC/Rec2 family competence protein [Pseudobdellovibrionaceae bacterium]